MPKMIGAREFTYHDQEWFAAVSGDRNPMHVDAVEARRTIAHFPVVHGIHTLLWALDTLFDTYNDNLARAQISIKARFGATILVNAIMSMSF
jgi:acyl dehydratase